MVKNYKRADFDTMIPRHRTRLINALSGFKSVNLVGTTNEEGQTNLSIMSSVIHLGANPPLMGFIMRPISVTRNTYDNIIETGYYTFNHITESIYQQGHQTAARYPTEISEFDATGLTTEYLEDFKAPFVQESVIKIGLKFRQKIDIPLNNTILIIGEVMELFFPEELQWHDGYLDIEQAGSITCSGLDSYHTTNRLNRLSYAKPDKALEVIKR